MRDFILFVNQKLTLLSFQNRIDSLIGQKIILHNTEQNIIIVLSNLALFVLLKKILKSHGFLK